MGIPKSFSIRHIKTIGIIVAVYSLIYGVGFFTGIGGFSDTLLYETVGDLMKPQLLGAALVVTGVALIYGYLANARWLISNVSNIQSFIWLFAAFVYVLSGQWLVAAAAGLVPVLLSSYNGYAFRMQDREEDQWILDNYLDL